MLVELRPDEAAVAREAAALHRVAGHDRGAAASGDRDQLVDAAHLARAADRVHRDRLGARRELEARQQRVVDEVDAVLDSERIRPALSSSGTRTGWCRTRSASGRRRSPRGARPRAPSTCGRRRRRAPCSRTAGRSTGRRARRDRRRRSRRAGTAARPRQAASRGRRRRAAAPCCAPRSSGSRRRARSRWARAAVARNAPGERAPATTWAAVRPRPCAGRRGRPA